MQAFSLRVLLHSEPTSGNLRHHSRDAPPKPNSAPIGRSTTGGVYKRQGSHHRQFMTHSCVLGSFSFKIGVGSLEKIMVTPSVHHGCASPVDDEVSGSLERVSLLLPTFTFTEHTNRNHIVSTPKAQASVVWSAVCVSCGVFVCCPCGVRGEKHANV